MATTFQNYLKSIDDSKIADARDWFRDQAMSVERVDTNKVIREQKSSYVSRLRIGHLYLYRYDALTKEKLPYYDRFPLIFVIRPMKEGFLGLNMHYLPFNYRARLMDALYEYVIGEEDKQRLRITYSILKNTSKLRFFRPCLKHYLNNQVRSRFVHVTPKDWDTALFLPLQRFSGASVKAVHKDSIQLIRRYSAKGNRI
jgi:hypothetical protein